MRLSPEMCKNGKYETVHVYILVHVHPLVGNILYTAKPFLETFVLNIQIITITFRHLSRVCELHGSTQVTSNRCETAGTV